ncbi:hypothetical protein CONPUDRAFT_84273 [Coniophora puteana RWD-64-598 SS2]|uniref:Uncharacterized protein n=1 Tax=Coniophora puteana (strain RWD-64-598) TaxID=741705 RepID=A0A5M3MEG0_CONPW|nr:uncharacterized protein CONPUDRAFT_84273 [Coniophora puteana RWD-64-598 SS2]EIW76995.1 hypothetical protein CONPUDRAFT_84273 [Coniophora puteana RWD-64-598 SS2]
MTCVYPVPVPLAPQPSPPSHSRPPRSSVSFASPVLGIGAGSDAASTTAGADGGFAFARVQGEICLVQISRPPAASSSKSTSSYPPPQSQSHPHPQHLSSPLTPTPASAPPIDLSVFRHEFVSIFRYSHRVRVPARDLRVLELLDDPGCLRHEEDSGTVFLAKDLALRLRRMADASAALKAGFGRPGYGQRRRS